MKIVFRLSMISLFLLQNNYAQTSYEDKNSIHQLKWNSKEFDSVSTISMQKKITDYKQYVGQQLYCIPSSKKYFTGQKNIINYLTTKNSKQIIKTGKIPFEKLFFYSQYTDERIKQISVEQYERWKKEYEAIDKVVTNVYEPTFYHEKTDATYGKIYGAIGTLPEKVEGKYFTILDIQKQPFFEKVSLKYEDLKQNELEGNIALKIVLLHEETKDTIYWNINRAANIQKYPFYLNSYFVKRQQLHLHKNLVALKELKNVTDIKKGELITIAKGEKWYCSAISFADAENSKHLVPFYFLRNEKYEIQIELENINNESFCTEAAYNSMQTKKRIVHTKNGVTQKM